MKTLGLWVLSLNCMLSAYGRAGCTAIMHQVHAERGRGVAFSLASGHLYVPFFPLATPPGPGSLSMSCDSGLLGPHGTSSRSPPLIFHPHPAWVGDFPCTRPTVHSCLVLIHLQR